MEDKFVSSMPSQSFDKALEGGLKFYNGEFVSEEQKQALTGPQGPQGKRGTGILKATTAPETMPYHVGNNEFVTWWVFETSKVLEESGASEVLAGDIIQHGSDHYLVSTVTSYYVYSEANPTSIKGDPGPAGAAATINGVNALNIAAGNGINATQSGSTLTLSVAGTFAGQVVANSSGQTPGTSLLRNSRLVSADTNPTVNGEINWTYK